MVCDNCHERESVVELIRSTGEGMTKLHLCERCAAEQGVEPTVSTPKHPLGEFLQAVQQQLTTSPAEATRCEFCGTTLKDFRATGRWGCAQCYSTFESSMRELLRRVHGHSKHVGLQYTAPDPGTGGSDSPLGDLRERLRRAVESEQFELAADLRDRIRVLE
ncbi:MAG: hypothetical protein NVS1B4_19370 [Gemmatimonadaceae bacterium]